MQQKFTFFLLNGKLSPYFKSVLTLCFIKMNAWSQYLVESCRKHRFTGFFKSYFYMKLVTNKNTKNKIKIKTMKQRKKIKVCC